MKTQYLNRLLIGLVLATVLALLWNRYGMNSALRIDARSPFIINAVDDRSSGGKSQSTLKREKGKLILECNIDVSYQWPYCEIAVTLKDPPAGMDLSRYDSVRLAIRYQGPEQRQQVRFFVRNYNKAYSVVGDTTSMKVQEIDYDPSQYPIPLEVDLSRFTVASWWTNSHKVPIEHAGTDFSNVPVVEVSTGGELEPGFHRITVDYLEFRGKLVSPAKFRLAIIAIWVFAIVLYFITDAMLTHRELSMSNRQQASLKRINEALRVQTQIYARLARHDSLTGVLNPKGLGDELFELAKKPDNEVFPMSLVFVDIDHFKKINEQHSHSTGDLVLKNLANFLKDSIQESNVLARWGGGQFLLVCPRTGTTESGTLAEHLRKVIATRIWPNGVRLTCSFGISELSAGEDLGEGIKRATEALHAAKENGRDRVEVQRAA